MATEQFVDVIIFGASGFTGKYVVRELLKFTDCSTADGGSGAKRTVGIAGRSKSKLSASLTWALEGKPSPVPVSIFEANVDDPASLASLVKKTRLLLNVVGPYRKYGEPVVKACVEAGVDYLDITGEPEFMEKIEANYHESAMNAGSLVVSACGYDSVPAELGVIHNERQFARPMLPQLCDSYLVLSNKAGPIHGNIGTWESALLGVAHEADLQRLRKSRPRRSRPQIPGSLTKRPSVVHYEPNSRTWAVKLPSADAIIVRRTFATRIDNPEGLPTLEDETNSDFTKTKKQKWGSLSAVQFGVYICSKTVAGVIGFFLLGIVLVIFAQFKWGRSLLVKYPEIFSFGTFLKQGPTEEDVRNSSFQQWFVGKGFNDASKVTRTTKPDKQIVTRISGPEIGYVTTPICLVQAALIVLDHRSTLPKGGVLTPGAVFGITDLQERIEKNGIQFDVVSTSQI